MSLEAFLRACGSELPAAAPMALAIALAGGLVASAVCPCTLPVGLGIAGAAGATETQSRRTGLAIAAAFFAGIVLNLTVLGALAGRLGAILTLSFGRYWALGMALVSLVAAIIAFAGPRLKVTQLESMRRPGVVGAFGYGFVFSLGTSAAPLLVLLTIAAAEARPEYGVALAFAFGIGRGLPFLLAGLFAGALARFVRINSWRTAIQIGSGCALLLVCGYYVQTFLALL